jgi:hypothetical protein
MEVLGGNFKINKGNLGIVPSPVLNADHLSHDEPIALTVDSFTNSDSRSPLEEMANQLERYKKVMDIGNPEQVAFLKDSEALLERMRLNVAAGKTTLEVVNKSILDAELNKDISQQIKELSDARSLWFSATGVKAAPKYNATKEDLQIAQNELSRSLENASPKEIAALRSEQEAAIIYNQENISVVDINLSTDTVVAKTTSLLKASEAREKNWRAELSELKKRLEDPSLIQEQRESLEQRIEKIDLALKFEDKIKNDKDFQDKIWSKLSKEQQESILDDIRDDGELTEESIQAINKATAAADKTQTINEGFFALSKQRMKDLTGMTHEDYYEKYRVQMNLDKSEFIKTNIDLKVYSRDSSYDSSSYSRNVINKNDSQNSSTAQEERREAAINQGLLEQESETKRMLAEQYGLDPSGHKLLISYLLNNDIVNAFEYAQEHGMTSLEESLQESMNRLAFQEVPINSRIDEFFNLSFS